MKVFNPNKLPLIDYHEVLPLQGELKDLSEANYNKLKNVLNKRGFKVPLFLWQQGDLYYLLDGHQRQRVMIKEDMQPYEVPYILIDAETEAEAKAQLLEIASQYGTITQEGFDSFTVSLPELDIQNINFDALQFVGQEPDVEEDEAPEVSSEPAISKLGEVYQLGRHRIMCGDSTSPEDLKKLMNGQLADMVFTDPPYNVDYHSESGNGYAEGKYKHEAIFSDNLSDEDFTEFLFKVGQAINPNLKEACPIYIWHGDVNYKAMPFYELFKKMGWTRSSSIIWAKNAASMGWQHYRSQHEVCSYGWNTKKPYFTEKRDQTTLWEESRDSTSSYDHPTQKPIALMARGVNNSSEKDGKVLDVFGGSGSTLIACEQLDRICYMMELDPKYTDVIRRRYWKFVNGGDETGWQENTPVIGVK